MTDACQHGFLQIANARSRAGSTAHSLGICVLCVLIVLILGCRDSSPVGSDLGSIDPDGEVASISISSGDSQVGMAGEILPEPLVVRATDSRGRTLSGVNVSWKVTSGTGRFSSPYDLGVFLEETSTLTGAEGTSLMNYMAVDLGPSTVRARAVTDSSLAVVFSVNAEGVVIVITGDSHWNRDFRAPTGSSTVAVPVGTIVEWVNRGSGEASVTSLCPDRCPPGGSSFESGVLEPGDRFQFVPNVSGTWEYVDGSGSWAHGTLVVAASHSTGQPESIAIDSGNNQDGNAGEALQQPLAVRVRDAVGKGVPGTAINWSIVSGAGSLEGSNASGTQVVSVTGVDGVGYVRFVPEWLGSSTIRATLSSNPALTQSFEVEATGVLVVITDRAFVAPDGTSEVAVPVGTTVEWINESDGVATVMSSCPEQCPAGGTPFDSGILHRDDRYEFVPNVPGTWQYTNPESWYWPDGTVVAYE